MIKPPSPFTLRPMALEDLEDVLAIEVAAFPTPTKPALFRYELTQNRLAHYQSVLVENGRFRLLGYAGYWIMADEQHISTIATHPDWRGRGLGELLLLNMLHLAYRHPVREATLEVRRGNQAAQALYAKYRFLVVGERRGYYKDTGEDALLMTVGPLDGRYRAFLARQQETLFRRLAAAESAS